jgi:hypothetical protein
LKTYSPVRLRILVLGLAVFCVAAALSQAAHAKEPSFDDVFNTKGEPRLLHYQAVYRSSGTEHSLEVWRDGDRRLKRRTDKNIESYLFREPGSTEFQMSVLDPKKKIRTRIGRTNLYRIGSQIDWFDMAHGLKHPIGPYTVAKAQTPAGAPKAVENCQWYDLAQGGRTTHICWSARDRLPVLIQTQKGEVVWRLTGGDRKTIPEKTFQIHDEGFVLNDANEDIAGD